MLLFLYGCSTNMFAEWKNMKYNEIQAAYDSGEITKKEYIELRLDVDQTLLNYAAQSRPKGAFVYNYNTN